MLLYRNDTVEKNLNQIKVRLLYSTIWVLTNLGRDKKRT
jgi:hypothetical protein